MTIYYLMVKTHKITGLKYLCQTKQKDPYKYFGSGLYWTSHLLKHGKEITTEILCECQTKTELKGRGEYYSELWNVVESNAWANLIPENGEGGSPKGTNKGKVRTAECIDKWRESRGGYVTSNITREKLAAALKGKPKTSEHKVNLRGPKSKEHCLHLSESAKNRPPVSESHRNELSLMKKGRTWWNNGVTQKMSKTCPGPEFSPGRGWIKS